MSDITAQTLTSLVNNLHEKKVSSEEVTKTNVTHYEKSKKIKNI